MMASLQHHVVLMVVYAFCVAVVAGVLTKDEPREQVRSAAGVFAGLLGSAFVAGWLLYALPL